MERGLIARLRAPLEHRFGNKPLRRSSIRDGLPVHDDTEAGRPSGGDRFVRLHASSGPMPPTLDLLLTDEAFVDPRYVGWHRDCGGTTPEVGVYTLDDALYHPRGMVMRDASHVLDAPELMPAYWRLAIDAGRVRSVHAPWSTARLDAPAIACITPGFLSYGHVLLEILPRLWLAQRHLGPAFAEHRILIDRDLPRWARALLQDALGVRDEQFLTQATNHRLLRVRRLVVPGLLHDDFRWHAVARECFDGLDEERPASTPSVFAITRPTRLPPAHQANRRVTENVDEIDRRIAARGIPSLRPERLPFRQQVALFRRASFVIGEYGSGLHNAVFGGADLRVLSLGFVNDLQSKLSALRRQRIGYLKPADERVSDGVTRTRFDADVFDRALDRLLS